MKDVTDLVSFEDNDGEYLPITKCVCGEKFEAWEYQISIYPEHPTPCEKCGRKLYFSNHISVFEIEEGEE